MSEPTEGEPMAPEAQAADLDTKIEAVRTKIEALEYNLAQAEASPEAVKDWARVGGWRERRTAEAASLTRLLAARAALEPALYAALVASIANDRAALKQELEATALALAGSVAAVLREMYEAAAIEQQRLFEMHMAIGVRAAALTRDDRYDDSCLASHTAQLFQMNLASMALGIAHSDAKGPAQRLPPVPSITAPAQAAPAPRPTGNVVEDFIAQAQAKRDAVPAILRPRNRA